MKNMEITDIRIKKVASEGKMKAVASVTFDNAFAVHDVKVIEVRKSCLLLCQAEELLTVSTEILLIR